MTLPEILHALADGKQVQHRYECESGFRDEKTSAVLLRLGAEYEFYEDCWRLKPVPVAPAMCECGHPVDRHVARGCTTWLDADHGYCTCRRDGLTAPKMVPLEWTDVNLQHDLFRWLDKAEQGVFTAHSASLAGLWVAGASVALSWLEVQRELERSTDAGATWQRAEKPEGL
jgi:hypothetical protein